MIVAPLVVLTQPVRAQTPPVAPNELKMDIDIIAQRLDLARQQIQAALGASAYSFSPRALETIPQGADAPLNQVLLRAQASRRTASGSYMFVVTTPTCGFD